MRKRRIKYIKETLFSQIWTDACSLPQHVFQKKWLIEQYQMIDRKYQISNKEWNQFLQYIYQTANIDFVSIIQQSKMKKSQFAAYFCIPIRTVESWCKEPHRCTPYMKLAILRELKLLKLTGTIQLQYQQSIKPGYQNNRSSEPTQIEEDQLSPEAWLEHQLKKHYERKRNVDDHPDLSTLLETTSYLEKHKKKN